MEEKINEEIQETPQVSKEQEYLDKLQRLQAEFENFQKRTQKEKLDLVKNANKNLIFKLLEVLDSFELALKSNDDPGVVLINDELNKILEKDGLSVIESKGKFNPEFHEALMQEEGKEDGIILEEFQKGYLLNDKLLRASKVKISTTK